MSNYRVFRGDVLEVLPTLPAEHYTAVLCDPPYGLSFMGKHWDHGVPSAEVWKQVWRVLKPGAVLFAFGGSRTWHRLAVNIEDAGFDMFDTIMWIYGSGFPKSASIDKAIDKEAGAEREVIATIPINAPGGSIGSTAYNNGNGRYYPDEPRKITAPSTTDAQTWQGYGTSMKPAFEPVIVARKPLPNEAEQDIIVGNLFKLEAQLWLLFSALTAGKSSTLSQQERNEASSIAQWSADAPISILADLSDRMDTLRLELAMRTTLNTVSSWRNTWEEALKHGSKFITSTATSPIIDLKTLSYSASALTPQDIIRAEMIQPGSWWNAIPAAKVLNAVALKLSATLELFAVENAIEKGHIPPLDETDRAALSRPILCFRKPRTATYAQTAIQHGSGTLNIDECRIDLADGANLARNNHAGDNGWKNSSGGMNGAALRAEQGLSPQGRWPANVIFDEEAAALLDEQSRELTSGKIQSDHKRNGSKPWFTGEAMNESYGDTVGASRFFQVLPAFVYKAKSSTAERNAGISAQGRQRDAGRNAEQASMNGGEGNPYNRGAQEVKNFHPTVKPLSLTEYLARLIVPPKEYRAEARLLVPFSGSGSEMIGALMAGWLNVDGIELTPEYAELAEQRLAHWREELRPELRKISGSETDFTDMPLFTEAL